MVKVTIEHESEPYPFFRMVPLSVIWVTSDPDFKVTIFFDIEYLRTTQDRAIITIERQ